MAQRPNLLARAISTSSALKDVAVGHAKIPSGLEIKKDETSPRKLLLPENTLREKSAEFFKDLTKLKSSGDKEAASLMKAIEDFRSRKIDVAVIEGIKKPTPILKKLILNLDYDLAARYDNPKRDKTNSTEKLTRHLANIDLIQIVLYLCGYEPNPERNPVTEVPAIFAIEDDIDQALHVDGMASPNADGTGVVNHVGVNSLYPMENSSNPQDKIKTVFVNIDDVVKRLPKEILETLEKPFFYSSRIVTPLGEEPKSYPAIIKKDGRWNILSDPSDMKIVINDPKIDKYEKARLEFELEQAKFELAEMAYKTADKSGFDVELKAPTKIADGKIVIFNNSELWHRRSNYSISTEATGRVVASVSASPIQNKTKSLEP